MAAKSSRTRQQEILRKKQQKSKKLTIGLISIGTLIILALFILPTLPVFKFQLNQIEMPPSYERPFVENDTMGSHFAPVLIEEFSSYSCNHCQTFVLTYEEFFVHNYISNELIQWKFIPVTYNDPTLNLASKATYCAMAQDKFWEYRDLVYANQGASSFYPYTEKSLTAFALKLDLDQNKFSSCLNDSIYDDLLEENEARVTEEDITGTPSFLVNGETLIIGADPEGLRDAIEAALMNSSTSTN